MTPLAPLILSWIGGVALLLADGRNRAVAMVAALGLALIAALDLGLLIAQVLGDAAPLSVTTGGWPPGIGIRLHVDGLSLYFATLCAGVLAAVMLHETRGESESRHLPGLLYLMCAGLHGAFFTADLFNFYVFFELAVVTSFVLASYGYGRFESRGAFIYMTVNLLGSMIFLVGVTGVYHVAGTLDFGLAENTLHAQREPIPLLGAVLLVALSLKLGLFPFHGWVPLLYSHARPAIAAALAGALVNIGAYGLLRIGTAVFPDTVQRSDLLLLTLGAAATVYGALLALSRRSPAELAAYLAITQAGYVMLGFGLGTEQGVVAVLLVVLTGSLDKTMMFLALDRRGWSRDAAAFVAAISTAGLPVTLGFLAKVQLFHAGSIPFSQPLVIGSLLVATPLTIAATLRYWRLAHTASPPVIERLGRPTATFALAAVSVLLGLMPQGLGELVASIGAELARV